MSPRYLGCKLVIARSFARLHITNLKKQGILPCVFADPTDFEKVQPNEAFGPRHGTFGVPQNPPGITGSTFRAFLLEEWLPNAGNWQHWLSCTVS